MLESGKAYTYRLMQRYLFVLGSILNGAGTMVLRYFLFPHTLYVDLRVECDYSRGKDAQSLLNRG